MDGLQVLGAHDVFVFHRQLLTGVGVVQGVGPAAHLVARAAVGAGVHLVEAHVAFAAHGHAEGAVAEHLEAHELAARAAHVLLHDAAVYLRHLVEVELPGEHHHVGPLGVELHRLEIGDVDLGGDVHLLADGACVENHGDVGGYDGRYAGLFRALHDAAHEGEVVVVDHGVDREVCLDAVGGAEGCDLLHVVEGEIGA